MAKYTVTIEFTSEFINNCDTHRITREIEATDYKDVCIRSQRLAEEIELIHGINSIDSVEIVELK